ncbi:MAG: peroxiredoxin family protein [Flavobacteriaceae bacterium]
MTKDVNEGNRSDNTDLKSVLSEFEVGRWIDTNGKPSKQLKLSDLKGKFKVVFCFQSWCPGCHSKGFPDLKQMIEALKDRDDIVFLAVQTVFEGFDSNTYEKMVATQEKYQLQIPFGHDAGSDGKSMSNIMRNYRTGGTPWFIFIDREDKIVFSDFHLNADAAVDFLKTV